jgi:Mg2+ and Co2+ transporter CorA
MNKKEIETKTTSKNNKNFFDFFSNSEILQKIPSWVASIAFTGFVFITLFIGLFTIIQPVLIMTIERDTQGMELKISDLEGRITNSNEMLKSSLQTMKDQAESIAILKNKNGQMEEREKVLIARESELIRINGEKSKRIEELEKEVFLLRERVGELENVIKKFLEDQK